MSGLLEKDFRLMRWQLRSAAYAIVFVIVLLFFTRNTWFGIAYFTIFSTTMCVSTITYDEFEKGYSYLFTMPITRRGYVVEKYVFGMLMVFLSFVLGTALTGTARLFPAGGGAAELGELLTVALAFLAIGMVLLSFLLPVYLKYGAGKGRTMILLVYLVLGGTVGIGVYVLVKMGVDLDKWLQGMGKLPAGALTAGAVLLLLLLLGASMTISFRIMERKEF